MADKTRGTTCVLSLAQHTKRTQLPTGSNQQQVPYNLRGSVRNVFGQALPHVRLELSKPGGLRNLQMTGDR
jgi:hypothetical protein